MERLSDKFNLKNIIISALLIIAFSPVLVSCGDEVSPEPILKVIEYDGVIYKIITDDKSVKNHLKVLRRSDEKPTDIVIPASFNYEGVEYYVKEIIEDAFIFSDIETVIIKAPITRLPERVFYSCENLREVELPESLESIGTNAFSECKSLEKINLPDNVKSFNTNDFMFCTSLKEITLGRSVERVYFNVEAQLDNLENIFVSGDNNNFTSVDGVLYSKDMTVLVNCPRTKDMFEIPSSVTEIGYGAFSLCKKWKGKIVIHDNIRIIGELAFAWCTDITELILGKNVEYIGGGSFAETDKMERIYSYNPVPPELDVATLVNPNSEMSFCWTFYWGRSPLYVPANSVEAYRNDLLWSRGFRNFETDESMIFPMD